ncbi:hypothetical protein Tco_1134746 [Tanacetum coccineum]
MTSITAQQTNLDLELVPKESRLDIGKCNGMNPRGLKTPKEENISSCSGCTCTYSMIDKKKRFKLTLEVLRDILSDLPRVPGHDFDALPSEEDTISFLRDLGHTGVINSLNDVVIDQMHQAWRTLCFLNISLLKETSSLEKLRLSPEHIPFGPLFVSRREASQIYGAVLPECLTSPEMKESKAYKTYLSYAIGEVPPKVARKFKKASPSKKERSKKEKLKGLSQDSILWFSVTVYEKPPSVEKSTPTVTSEGTSDKPGFPM